MLYDLSRSVIGINPSRKDLDFLKKTTETWLIPPEIIQEHSGIQEYISGEKIDIYHLGVTIFISLYLKPPFKKASSQDPFYSVLLKDLQNGTDKFF